MDIEIGFVEKKNWKVDYKGMGLHGLFLDSCSFWSGLIENGLY